MVRHHDVVFKLIPPRLKAVNPVGCVDSMVEGIITTLYQSLNVHAVYTFGTTVTVTNALEERD